MDFLLNLSTFWENLASGFILLFLGSIILPKYLRWAKEPRSMEFFFNETGSNAMVAYKDGNGVYKFEFEPVFRHDSVEYIKEGVFWQIIFPIFVDVKVVPIGKNTLPGNNDPHSFFGKIDQPVFKDVTMRLQYKFICEFSLNEEIKDINSFAILTCFSTEYGDYPRSLKRNNDRGDIDVRTMQPMTVYLDDIVCPH